VSPGTTPTPDDRDTVRRLVHVCAFMLDQGDSLLGAVGEERLDWQEVDPEQRVLRVTEPGPTFYADLPTGLAAVYSGRLTTQTVASFAQPLSGAAWKTIDSTYLVCNQDRAIPPAFQRIMAERATHRREIDSSHTPMASRPQVAVRGLWVRAAGARAGSACPGRRAPRCARHAGRRGAAGCVRRTENSRPVGRHVPLAGRPTTGAGRS
jgi:hypothetical protein